MLKMCASCSVETNLHLWFEVLFDLVEHGSNRISVDVKRKLHHIFIRVQEGKLGELVFV